MQRRQFLSSAGLLAIIGGSAFATYEFVKPPTTVTAQAAPAMLAGNSIVGGGYRFQRLVSPNRTLVLDTSGTQLASFTD